MLAMHLSSSVACVPLRPSHGAHCPRWMRHCPSCKSRCSYFSGMPAAFTPLWHKRRSVLSLSSFAKAALKRHQLSTSPSSCTSCRRTWTRPSPRAASLLYCAPSCHARLSCLRSTMSWTASPSCSSRVTTRKSARCAGPCTSLSSSTIHRATAVLRTSSSSSRSISPTKVRAAGAASWSSSARSSPSSHQTSSLSTHNSSSWLS